MDGSISGPPSLPSLSGSWMSMVPRCEMSFVAGHCTGVWCACFSKVYMFYIPPGFNKLPSGEAQNDCLGRTYTLYASCLSWAKQQASHLNFDECGIYPFSSCNIINAIIVFTLVWFRFHWMRWQSVDSQWGAHHLTLGLPLPTHTPRAWKRGQGWPKQESDSGSLGGRGRRGSFSYFYWLELNNADFIDYLLSSRKYKEENP